MLKRGNHLRKKQKVNMLDLFTTLKWICDALAASELHNHSELANNSINQLPSEYKKRRLELQNKERLGKTIGDEPNLCEK